MTMISGFRLFSQIPDLFLSEFDESEQRTKLNSSYVSLTQI